MKIKFIAVIIPVLLTFNISGFSRDIYDNGTRGLILNVIPDARLTGMGGPYTALADDSGSVFYNPAGLANVEHIEIPFARNYLYQNVGKLFEPTQQLYYGLVYNFRDITMSNIRNLGTFAVMYHEINDGRLPERDRNGNLTGNFNSNDRLLTIAYGRKIIEIREAGTLMMGVSAKIFREILFDGYEVNGKAYDLGAIWKFPGVNIFLGSAVQNIGQKVLYENADYCLPLKTAFGLGGKMLGDAINFGVDYVKPHHEEFRFNLGTEFWLLKTIAFRIGYNRQISPDLGLNAGWGVSFRDLDFLFFYIREISINYGHGTHGELGGEFSLQRLSLNIKLGAD